MKDYYKILQVRRGASAAEIRRAYRVLVQQLHPDVNPDLTAHELIKEVNEAYDVLGDATKKQEYDYRLDNPYVTVTVPEEPAHRDRAYRRRGPYRPRPPQGPTQRDLMQRYIHITAKISWAGLALCLLLMIDVLLPHQVIEDTIVTFLNTGRSRYESNYLITQSGEKIKMNSADGRLFRIEQPIVIVKSRLLSILMEVRIPETDTRVNNLSTIYANFKFVPLLLALFSTLGLITKTKGSIEFRFNLGIVSMFVLIFTLILLLK